MSPGAPGALGRWHAGCRRALTEADAGRASHVAIIETSAAHAAISWWSGALHLTVSAGIYSILCAGQVLVIRGVAVTVRS